MSRRTSPAIEVARPSPTSDPEDILGSPAGGAPRSADPLADQALDFGRRALGLTHHPTLQADRQTGNARADFGRSAARQLGSSGAQLPVYVTQSRTVTGLPPTSRDGSDLFRLEFSVSTPQPHSDWGPKARWFKSSRPDSPEVSAQLCTVERPQSRAQFARWCRAVQGSRQTQIQTHAAGGASGVWNTAASVAGLLAMAADRAEGRPAPVRLLGRSSRKPPQPSLGAVEPAGQ